MSQPQAAKPSKLVISIILREKKQLFDVARVLESEFGPTDLISPWFDFDYTDYYEPEMGAPLFRRMLSYKRLIKQKALAEIKICTNAIEYEFAENGHRRINLDPGYLLHERFVLASGKNYSHRIYIGKGIYADLTLIFQKGEFQSLSWTYPDYAAESMRTFLLQARKKYTYDLMSVSK